MSVHYKFKSALEFDTVTFDGLHISVRDLKKAILHQKRIGKNTDFDLQITNAQTKEVYCDDGALIPKNTSLIVARIPLTAQQKKAWDRAESNQQLSGIPKGLQSDIVLDGQDPGLHRLAKAVDLSSLDASEEDKIQAMMTQSTQDYNPSNYMKIRGANQMGEVPSNYRCYKCHQPGHWIKNCPLGTNTEPIEIKKSTGIPRSFMVPVDGPSVPGAMMTPTGQFAVPAIDHQAYKEGKKERPPFQPEPEHPETKLEIPEDLLCSVCKDLLTDAVMIPCCGNSFCDECIRTVLLESEDHECPDCKEKDVSPDTLIPNRFLRNNVNNFKNITGYNKVAPRQPVRMNLVTNSGPPIQEPPQAVPVLGGPPPDYSSIPPDQPRDGIVPQVITSGALVHVPTAPTVSSAIPVLGGPKVIPLVPETNSTGIVHPLHQEPPGDPIPSHIHGPPPRKGIPLQRPDTTLTEVSRPEPGASVPPSALRATLRQEPPPPLGHTHSLEAAAVAPVQVPEHSLHRPPPHLTGPPGLRRSLEERPGTPTIDEHNLDTPSQLPPTLPDTSVPPPNFPPGEEPQFHHSTEQPGTHGSVAPVPSFQIETVETRAHRLPFRPTEHSYGPPHRLGGQSSDYPHPRTLPPPQLRSAPPPEHARVLLPRPPPPNTQPPPPAGNFGPRGTFDGPPTFHHEPGSRPPSHYEMDREGHPVSRGGYRGYGRGRGRGMMHGGYRGSHVHHQPPPPGLGRGSHSAGQAGTIEDPLEAFQRMLREKDDRDRKLRRGRRSRTRSRSFSRSRSTSTRTYSRSRSRTRSRSRSRTPRSRTPRSRTPRKRSRTRTRSRTRSRSFTISRSRSRSFSRSLTPRGHSPREREFSPRRRRFRTPTRTPPRYQRPFKDVRNDYEPAPYFESEYQYGGGRGRGGRFGPRKDFNKDYSEQSYNRYGSDYRYSGPGGRGEPLPHVPGVGRFDNQPPNRRFEPYDVVPPGTGPDIPISSSRYDRGYEGRLPPDDYLAPPGVDHRRPDSAGYGSSRDRDVGNRDRDVGPPGIRDRDIVPSAARDRDSVPSGGRDRDIIPSVIRERDGLRDRDMGSQSWETRNRESDVVSSGRDARDTVRGSSPDRLRDKDRERDMLSDRERDRGRDYYDSEHRRSYGYNSPDGKRRRQSASPRRAGSRERYSSSERHHRHGSRRRNPTRDGGKENRHASQQPVEPVELTHDRDRDKEKDIQKRERVLVEVRKEPSVEKERSKKEDKPKKEEEKDKKGKEKKKKKKEKEADAGKKKKRKEKKDAKKEGQESGKEQEKVKTPVKSIDKKEKALHKEKAIPENVNDQRLDDNSLSEPGTKEKVLQDKGKPPVLGNVIEKVKGSMLRTFDAPPTESIIDGLYGDMEDTRIDDSVIANYGKVVSADNKNLPDNENDQVVADQEEWRSENGENMRHGTGNDVVKTEPVHDSEGVAKVLKVPAEPAKANIMLAPLPEPSKWELEEEMPGADDRGNEEPLSGGTLTPMEKSGKVVTSEVIKRAENAIFQKAINAIRPIEPVKKIVSERKVYANAEKEKKVSTDAVVTEPAEANNRKVIEKDAREARKTVNSIQITIPIAGHVERSVELSPLESAASAPKSKGKLDRSKFSSGGSQWGDGNESVSPQRVPAKERLGARVDVEKDDSRAKERYDNRERDDRSRKTTKHRSRSDSRERERRSRKGLKSAIERKRSISRSRSRSPHRRKLPLDRREVKDMSMFIEPVVDRRYAEIPIDIRDRKYIEIGDSRRKYVDHGSRRGERESREIRYADQERDRWFMEQNVKRSDSRERRERRRERSESRDRKVKEREKSLERVKSKHKAKKKTKRSDSRSRKKSVSDRESKRGKKRDKKHRKEKTKKHKQKDSKDEKKEAESANEKDSAKESDPLATKDFKANPSNDVSGNGASEEGKAAPAEAKSDATDQKEKVRKTARRNPRLASDRKRSTLDEASFEPDYDASSSVDTDVDEANTEGEKKSENGEKKSGGLGDSPTKKRDRSGSVDEASTAASSSLEKKRQKAEKESDKTSVEESKKSNRSGNGKSTKKRGRSASSSKDESSDDESSEEESSSSGSSSSSEEESSDDSSVHRPRKKKSSRRRRRKRNKKSSKRADTSSESESDSDSEDISSSDSDGGRGRKNQGKSSKKRHHRNRAKGSKKKKKSKHR